MSEYSITTVNRFALSVDEDEDLYELLEKQQQEKKKKEEQAAEAAKAPVNKGKGDKKGALKPTSANKQKLAKPVDSQPVSQQQTNQKPYPRNDENRPPRFAKQAREGNETQNFEKPPQTDGFGGRGRGGRGGFGGRGGRGGNRNGFSARGGKREFERHSGSDKTGVKAVEKKEGSGAHNWGDEIEAQLAPETQAEPVPETEPTTESTENAVVLEDKELPEPDKEEKTMTLDEWKASQRKTANTEFKTRKPNEGVDTKQWKPTVLLQKKKKGDHSDEEEEEDDEDEEGEEEEDEEIETTKSTLEKLNIQVVIASDQQRGGRGRGGFRGRGGSSRGSRGRGGRRDGGERRDFSKPYKSSLDSEIDFPSLGSR